jgi:hypothetical protein
MEVGGLVKCMIQNSIILLCCSSNSSLVSMTMDAHCLQYIIMNIIQTGTGGCINHFIMNVVWS